MMLQNFTPMFPRTPNNFKRLEQARPLAEDLLKEPVSPLPYSTFQIFQQSGSRVEYEAVYMAHRKRLYLLTAMALWEQDTRWTDALADAIWAVCDEALWALPAHLAPDATFTAMQRRVDLFAAETAQALGEILYLLGDRIPALVQERAKSAIYQRVLIPFIEDDMHYSKNNWCAVCAGCVAITLMELDEKELFARAEGKILRYMEDFLSSYPEDGCCLEGILYWSYGFGYFCYASSMLREYTNGRLNLFQEKKVAAIAAFRDIAFLQGAHTVPFADTGHLQFLHGGLAALLTHEFALPPIGTEMEIAIGHDYRWRLADMIRDFYWAGEMPTQAPPDEATHYLPDAAWLVAKRKHYAFAAKGGSNNEPHNHNDLGCFVLFAKEQYIIDDLGWPEYVAGYFGKERYQSICASSRGHSVPLLNGKEQTAGENAVALVLEQSDTTFVLDLSCGYGEAPGTLIRRFDLEENGVTVTDSCKEGYTLQERFVSRLAPVTVENGFLLGGCRISCASSANALLSSDTFHPRNSISVSDLKDTETTYFLDFSPTKNVREMKFVFRFDDL